ncbi:LacI family transcriptional regulator [Microbacterium sp. W4I4]|uniref:LacI family DNA-binding transcriptional regulator n=1 Tax=Microbacterium sp. W4I4 TaxID=3042295 RepID=UPI0027874B02|nr:LacI family DNA-binding transcriptional regulator [Microbacterium sp. W4I4]MDQ0614090.1 LacI family transcriptional regulator [Microbacterium sp. W4I4]
MPRAKITEVAREAGVSLSTVSRVMNGNPTVDAALAERVREVAARLGYSANPLARSLVLGRTQTISVVVPDLANPTFQAILRGLSHAASKDGYHVLISDTEERVEDEQEIAVTTRRRTDGVILCAPRLPQDELSALLPAIGPAVVINRPPQPEVPTVSADYGVATAGLIAHLQSLGHRRLAFLSGAVRSASGEARRRAIAAASDADPALEVVEISAGVDFDSGAAAADAVLASGATAALAFNDLVAMGLLSAVTSRGVRVPDDLSIAGFDDIPFSAYTSPPLTTASVPAADLGERAWAAMHALLSGGEPETDVTLAPQIVVRASTAPAAH